MTKSPLLILALSLAFAQLPGFAEPQAKIDFSHLQNNSEFGKRLNKINGPEGELEAPGPVLTAEQLRAKAAKSTALLELGGALGTGWFVAPAWLVTNHHMIADGTNGTVETPGGMKGIVRRIVADDPVNDLAILEIQYANMADLSLDMGSASNRNKGKLADDIPVLQLANPHYEVKEGSKVYEYGNPKGYKGTFTEGVVSAFRDRQQVSNKLNQEVLAKLTGEGGSSPIEAVKGGNLIQYSTQSDHGSSGSALLNDRGRVIGVCKSADPTGHDVYFAVSAKNVRELLEKAKNR